MFESQVLLGDSRLVRRRFLAALAGAGGGLLLGRPERSRSLDPTAVLELWLRRSDSPVLLLAGPASVLHPGALRTACRAAPGVTWADTDSLVDRLVEAIRLGGIEAAEQTIVREPRPLVLGFTECLDEKPRTSMTFRRCVNSRTESGRRTALLWSGRGDLPAWMYDLEGVLETAADAVEADDAARP